MNRDRSQIADRGSQLGQSVQPRDLHAVNREFASNWNRKRSQMAVVRSQIIEKAFGPGLILLRSAMCELSSKSCNLRSVICDLGERK